MTGGGVGENTFIPKGRCRPFSALHAEVIEVEICVWNIVDKRMLMMTYWLRPWDSAVWCSYVDDFEVWIVRVRAETSSRHDVFDLMVFRQKERQRGKFIENLMIPIATLIAPSGEITKILS